MLVIFIIIKLLWVSNFAENAEYAVENNIKPREMQERGLLVVQ